MIHDGRSIFEFEGFQLNPASRELAGPDGEAIKLMPKAFDILTFLVENRDRVVSKDVLFSELWPNTVVEENNLTQNISALRRAFGEKPYENRFITTIPGRGYRFVADVRVVDQAEYKADLQPETVSGAASSNERSRRMLFLRILVAILVVVAIGGPLIYYALKRPPENTVSEQPPAREPKTTTNPEAYQLFMRGKYHTGKLIRGEVQKAIAFYEQAISLDPEFAMAYVELAHAYRAMVLTNDAAPAEMMPRAKAAAKKAVELDENLAQGWMALAMSDFWFDWDWALSETRFKRAVAIDPNDADSHAFYAHLLSNTGRHNEAVAEIRRAREINPLSPMFSALEGQILFFAGRDTDSTVVLQSIVDIDPNFWLAHLFLSRNYLSKGMYPEALRSARKAKELTGGNAEATATEGWLLGKLGQKEDARRVLAELESRSEKPFLAYATAQVYLGLSEKDRALKLLELAYERREPLMVFIKLEPKLEGLRNEPRFLSLLGKMRLDQ
jgi:DNA-binding winged helix-turn-helix (wHTH) protein/tetratricopeptide (TPR) repeat protein